MNVMILFISKGLNLKNSLTPFIICLLQLAYTVIQFDDSKTVNREFVEYNDIDYVFNDNLHSSLRLVLLFRFYIVPTYPSVTHSSCKQSL